MNEKPILFSGPMIRAILEEKKPQTRRVMKPQPEYRENASVPGKFGTFFHGWNLDHPAFEISDLIKHCPYAELTGRRPDWKIEGRLWVKETFFAFGEWNELSAGRNKFTFYRHHYEERPSVPLPVRFIDNPPKEIETGMIPGIIGWYKRPSIFLERKDSRINLEITNIRVERLQDISREDAKDEGFHPAIGNGLECWDGKSYGNANLAFRACWDSINGKPRPDGVDISWSANPWVWVVTFNTPKTVTQT